MSSQAVVLLLLLALGFAAAMVSLGMNLGLLSKPRLTSRCGACGRLVRRGRLCECARTDR
jgi:hypothetical protein